MIQRILSFFAISLAFSGAAHAAAEELYLSAGYLGVASSSDQIDISPGVQFKLFPAIPWLQFGGEATFQRTSYRGSDANNLLLMAGFTGNIGPTLADGVFISFGVAYRTGKSTNEDDSTDDPNGVGYYFIAGKRFPISANVAIRPSMGIVSCGTTGLVFRPLAISYIF